MGEERASPGIGHYSFRLTAAAAARRPPSTARRPPPAVRRLTYTNAAPTSDLARLFITGPFRPMLSAAILCSSSSVSICVRRYATYDPFSFCLQPRYSAGRPVLVPASLPLPLLASRLYPCP